MGRLRNVTDNSIIAIVGIGVTFVFGALTVIWNIYSKASATNAKLDEKINTNTSACSNKQRELQRDIDHNREMISQARAELFQALMEHKVDTINRQDVNLLMEEKIKPIRDSVEEMKFAQRDTHVTLSKVLQSLARIEGSMGISAKRSEDY
jgi:hypothetical protein